MTYHPPKTAGWDAPPWSLTTDAQPSALSPLSLTKLVQDHLLSLYRRCWCYEEEKLGAIFCTKYGQNRSYMQKSASWMVCGVKYQMTGEGLEKTNRAGPLHFSVICKTLRSCRSCSGMRTMKNRIIES